MNTFCGQNSEIPNVRGGGTYKLPLCFEGLKFQASQSS